MIYAWLHIAPEDYETNELHGGTQSMFSAPNVYELEIQMNGLLIEMGAEPNISINSRCNTEGAVNSRPLATRPSGLMWTVFPCYSDGTNVDVIPNEPRGE